MAFYESPLDPKSDYVIYEWYLSDSDDSERRRFNMWMLELKELWASFITVFWLVFLLEIISKKKSHTRQSNYFSEMSFEWFRRLLMGDDIETGRSTGLITQLSLGSDTKWRIWKKILFFSFCASSSSSESKRSQKHGENSCLQVFVFRFSSCKMPGNLWCLKGMIKNDICNVRINKVKNYVIFEYDKDKITK